MAKSFGGTIKLQGASEYKQALSQITQNLKVVSAEMKATSSAFDAGNKSEEEMRGETEKLNNSLDTQRAALDSLKKDLAKLSSEYESNKAKHQELIDQYDEEKKKLSEIESSLGKSSQEYQDQQKIVENLNTAVERSEKSLNSQEKAMNNMRIQTANAETTLNQTTQALDSMGNEAEESGKKAEKSSDGFTVMKGILANLGTQAINGVINGLKSLGSAMVDAVADVGAFGDEIDKESQKLGLTTDTYQELSYALERNGASIDDVSRGVMNITNAITDTKNGVEGASESFDALGVSLMNADGSMKSSEEVLLESIDALSQMEDATQRNALTNDIFGRSYQELVPLLNAGSAGISDLMNEAEEYGMVMDEDAVKASAAFEDSLTKMKGTMTGVKNSLVGSLLPSITMVVNGFADLAIGSTTAQESIKAGISGMISQIQEAIPEILTVVETISAAVFESAPMLVYSLAEGILSTLPELMPTFTGIITEAISMLLSLVPMLAEAGTGMITGLIQGITTAIPTLLGMLPTIITQTVTTLLNSLPQILNAGMELLKGLANGIISAIPELISQLPSVIDNIVTFLLDSIPLIIQTGISLLTSLVTNIDTIIESICAAIPVIIMNLVDALIEHIPDIVTAGVDLLVALVSNMDAILEGVLTAIPEILDAILTGLAGGVSSMAEVGLQLVQGLWEGISDAADWVLEKIEEFGEDILNGIKDFFGIASPSKVFENEVGKFLAEGIGVGFEDEMKNVSKEMQESIPTSFEMDTKINATGQSQEMTFEDITEAFKEALFQVKIEMNDEEMGKFVDSTVTNLVYS